MSAKSSIRNFFIIFVATILSSCGGGSSGGDSGGGQVNDPDPPSSPVLSALTLDVSATNLAVGGNAEISVVAEYSDGSEKNVSSDVDATVSDADSLEVIVGDPIVVTSLAWVASPTVEIQYQEGDVSLTETVEFQVAAAITELQLDPSELTLPALTRQTVQVYALYDDGAKEEVTDQVEWGVGNQSIATINSNAEGQYVEGLAEGETSIRAELASESVAARILVTSPIVEALIIEAPLSMHLAEPRQLKAIAHYQGGQELDVTSDAIWSSSNTNVATVDNESSPGRVSPVSAGNVTISASLGEITSGQPIEVLAAVLTSIAITPESASSAVGQNTQFEVAGSYDDGSTEILTPAVEWSFSDPSLVELDAETPGLIAAIAEGTTGVTALIGEFQATATLDIAPKPDGPASITLTATPNVILDDGIDQTVLGARVIPNSPDGEIENGTEVVLSADSDALALEETQLTTLDARVSTNGTGSEAVGFVNITAQVPGTNAQGTVKLGVVETFLQVVLGVSSSNVELVDNVYQEGSSFTFQITNTSNRDFELRQAQIRNGTTILATIEASDSPELLNDGVLLGGGEMGLTYTLQQSITVEEGENISFTYTLYDPPTTQVFRERANY
ncbi:Ig-like domain-containing protein [Marinimicrobium sp. C2-29]|uniref:Ig-like domain-containing protein n=1 Tax=Marinimicrobium sp. C2-29 TaxID=3139825 RepID=UPI0031387BE5